MRGIRLAGVALCMVIGVAARPPVSRAAGAPKVDAPADPSAEPLKAKGLVKSGNGYVLAGEAEVLESMKSLRQNRKQAERENGLRKKAEDKVAANQKVIQDGIKEYKESEKRLPKIKDVNLHNRTVTRMNALGAKVKEAIDSQKDLEEAANKVPSEGRTKYVESLTAVAPKVEALAAKYKLLAADPAVKAALDKLNAKANPKLTVAPSPDFSRAVDEVATWRSQLDSEAIPLRESHGVYTVEVVVNGGEPLHMLLDTGASNVTLPFEVAQKLGLTPGEQDPTVQMKLANGAIIEGKLMTLKSVRVGRFTVPNVSCVVLQQGLPDPPTILGTSFLNHFVVKLSQSARELYLTEVGEGGKSGAEK
jgi:aspartyl protease family protein